MTMTNYNCVFAAESDIQRLMETTQHERAAALYTLLSVPSEKVICTWVASAGNTKTAPPFTFAGKLLHSVVSLFCKHQSTANTFVCKSTYCRLEPISCLLINVTCNVLHANESGSGFYSSEAQMAAPKYNAQLRIFMKKGISSLHSNTSWKEGNLILQ